MRDKNVLVTGGAGFIGSHLARALVEAGARVRVLDDLSSGRLANLGDVRADVEVIEGRVQDPEACRRAVEGREVVFHEAAIASVAQSVAEPLGVHDANATGTLVVVDACRRAGVPRLVYAGSSAAYGDSERLPKVEDMPVAPLSPYAASKLVGEHYVQMAAGLFGLHTVVLRYFNVFGPRQDPTSPYAAVIAKFAARMQAGERPVIFGDGLQSRDFVYVDDVVQANLLAASSSSECAAQVFNIARGERQTLLDLVAALNCVLGTRLEPVHEPARAGDVRHSLADISRARAGLGYAPRVSFEEGLRRTVGE